MKATLASSGKEIASAVAVAKSMASRMKGLLGRSSLAGGEGLLIKPCKGIHTFGMRFPIDVVFLDKEDRLVAVKKNMPPNRISAVYFSATSVLELPAGTLDSANTTPGDRIVFSDMSHASI